MLTGMVAHQAGVSAAHDLWTRWNADPLIFLGLVLAAWAYHRGTRRRRQRNGSWRSRCFYGALVAVGIAVLSPLDALAHELASAHMVQHVLLMVIAAPLVAVSAPVATMLAGAPPAVARAIGRTRRRLRFAAGAFEALRRPAVAWLLATGTLWFWHASGSYDAAVEHDAIHALEHASLIVTGVLFWSAIVHVRRAPPTSYGYGALLVFTMALQSVFLAALLTFATTPWYGVYRTTTSAWGIDPLVDQQLAGAIMWVPAGFVYVGVGVSLVARWIRAPGSSMDLLDDDWGFGADRGSSSAGHARRDEDRGADRVDHEHEIALHSGAP
ncbi:MAG: cytochrome c oxidase assembly protein [Actinomycetota bacterium]|nr:cytochrome c oxidase assembly protein [Actinomycetota bacterium]